MDSGVIVTSMGIGAAIFAALIIFWFFHLFIKRRLGAGQSLQTVNTSKYANGTEMRQHPRLASPWPATVELRYGSIRGRLRDISPGGAFVICQDSIPLNTKFRLYIEVPNQETFALNAEVVWSNMNVPKEKVIYRGMGVKFVQNTDAARKRLEEAISFHVKEAKGAADGHKKHATSENIFK
jgi:Tfp pilus assembly protein PilZ